MYKKIRGLVVSLTAVFACAAWAEVPVRAIPRIIKKRLMPP